ncbi:TIGR03084 family metal-binding protein [Ruegeria sp. PrR005]|uniref:TIGR03084 family protein n=1 Tax=Ruegeria sp. PrR005 TaxID=2706882 RepID=A0A6B2NWL1_9RHOB|nr:TIGR03084 family metal-binding protein [Ruegeria sp. PrR005]NDW47838.1 TIGR03084 family protein [Ruegeria sp. PrR005]
MEQAGDFLAESEALDAVLADVNGSQWEVETQFKGWTLNDVLVHLHFWNQMADLSLTDEAAFQARLAETFAGIGKNGFRATENTMITERGADLRTAWCALYTDMGRRWADLDPKRRVKWAGPEMSVRSSITARQMETWAHGQEVFDILGVQRQEADRVKNIVILGVNTFGWSYKVHGRAVPETMPRLDLTAPSGAVWSFGEPGENRISGPAVEFAQVVAQTRNIADTSLLVEGPVAAEWMSIAQCFAGGAETPPSKGARHQVTR